MKKLVCVGVVCTLLLTGCAAEPTWETVDDCFDQTVSAPVEQPYQIMFSVPMEAVLETFSRRENGTVYSHPDGDYEIQALVLQQTDIDEIILDLTGFLPETVQRIETERYAMPEYQFVWYTTSEEGGWLHQADVLTDRDYSYALIFSAREHTGTTYHSCRADVMRSFGLYTYEGV